MNSNSDNREKNEEIMMNYQLKGAYWMNIKTHYVTLKERLSAMISGQQKYGQESQDDEALVLLGDNFFVARNAKQAQGICDRFIARCDRMLADIQRERIEYQNWVKMAKEFFDVDEDKDLANLVDISEPYDEEKEAQWRQDHARKVREYKLKCAQERLSNQSEGNSSMMEEEYAKKLEKLELEELEEEKKKGSKKKESILKKSSSEGSKSSGKSVNFDETVGKREVEEQKCQSITIVNEPSFDFKEPTIEHEKNIESKQVVKEKSLQDEDSCDNEIAFTNKVIERHMNETKANSAVQETGNQEKMSRFKAARMARLNN